ncbi:MAG TPA: hypothetical protein VL128_11715 [Candidatus Eisenbacteria bacterium]|nr:hypothetical protein [Candidatus Eisenbacteria bacterium]
MRKAEFAAGEQQLTPKLEGAGQSEWDEGWGARECRFSSGQQLWREGEGSGLGAGEAPAGATTAARDWRPEHAMTRWLTVQASSATIRTTPRDRLLAIAAATLHEKRLFFCDWHHTFRKYAQDNSRQRFAAEGRFAL